MRHQKARRKLGRMSAHRDSLVANIAVGLITHGRVKTTLAKAKVVGPYAEKLVTLGKKGGLHHRRLAIARIHSIDAVQKLFADIAPGYKTRQGGYTRITKLGPRQSDSSPMAILEWVEASAATEEQEPAAAAAAPIEVKAEPVTEAPKAEAAPETAPEAPASSESSDQPKQS
ncbi:MAG: 50S ribosomal protein L17 [Candidatus Methylacidiphilales bacterium]|nr:50S ribosomal protein L17 [Candidatus Methylacidiphilales bacterium]